MVREDSVRTIPLDVDNVAQSVGAGGPNSTSAIKLVAFITTFCGDGLKSEGQSAEMRGIRVTLLGNLPKM